MIYIYTTNDCPKCTKIKNKLENDNISFEERSADRIKNPMDEIDAEAMIEASMNNMQLPIVIEV